MPAIIRYHPMLSVLRIDLFYNWWFYFRLLIGPSLSWAICKINFCFAPVPSLNVICSYPTERTAFKFKNFRNYLEKTEKAFIIVAEALAKHQATDYIGHRAAQEEAGIKGCSWGREKGTSKASVGFISPVLQQIITFFSFFMWLFWCLVLFW